MCGSIDFNEYCKLREGEHAFYIEKGCSRKWMNISDEERDASGINILWPDLNNSYFKEELERIENEKTDSPNNISPIIKYSLKNGVTVLWFGDLENDFLEKIQDYVEFCKCKVIIFCTSSW